MNPREVVTTSQLDNDNHYIQTYLINNYNLYNSK